jgi:cellulose synthase/poly-beta-1,6-N-acetylglucosamine synthase-like glycosyltransferase
MSWAAATFWAAIAVPIYAYAGYPLVLLGLRLVIRRPVKKAAVTPLVSLLIPARNEARVIERKILNSFLSDYPIQQLEIVVVSDGSTDETEAIARRFEDGHRLRVLARAQSLGKMAALNAAVPEARGQILVFSDASAMLAPESLRRIVENFADPRVGAVSGLYQVVRPGEVNIGASESLYWKYETFLKIQESRLASTLGGHGQLHAIRRELYPFPPAETINDDYVIPVSVLARGYRAVYEPGAVVREEAREMTGFARRIRIMAGNLQQLRGLGPLFRPLRPLPLFFFLSHKVARLAAPFAMLGALAANLFLLHFPLYAGLFWAQIAFYGLAALGMTGRLRPKALTLPFYFCMVNAAAFFGLYHVLTRRRSLVWK